MKEPSVVDQARFKDNIWEENFANVTQWILENTRDRFEGWQWINNSRCKYISLRIDMRDGGFIIVDRDGTRISFDQLKYQYGQEDASKTDVADNSRRTPESFIKDKS